MLGTECNEHCLKHIAKNSADTQIGLLVPQTMLDLELDNYRNNIIRVGSLLGATAVCAA